MTDEQIHAAALKAGCRPLWWDGIFGPAWHCGCADLKHAGDSQCSMITEASLNDGPADRARDRMILRGMR